MAIKRITPNEKTYIRALSKGGDFVAQALLDLMEGVAAIVATPGSGWISIADISVVAGTASNKVYDDAPNNTIVQAATISGLNLSVTVRASAPRVTVNGASAILPPHASGGYYVGPVLVSVLGSGNIVAQVTTSDGALGAVDTAVLTLVPPPTILTLALTGPYPGAQTELKAGDTFQVSGTTNVPCVGVEVQNTGAGTLQTINFASTTSFTVTVTIADRGTSLQNLSATMKAKDSNGAFGALKTTSNTVALNNIYPTVTFGTNTYPATQAALKGSEIATVGVTLSNLSTVLFDSPNSELSVTDPTIIEAIKTVTRIAGSYNVSTNNLRGTATRAANGTQTISQTVVAIANVAPTIDITLPAARLRSGGNDGTTVQGHTITITANQQLLAAPSLVAGVGGGTFIGGAFAGGPSVWIRTLNVHDNNVKGAYAFTTLVATGLAGLVQNTINSGSAYTLGGFVARSLTFGPFSTTTSMTVAVIDFSKLQAGIFTATNQTALKQPIGTSPSVLNGYTISALVINPTTVIWLDTAAAGSNSGGTAQIIAVEEVV